ncbi:16S rRNA (uracil(1498)-N(3))-methyltransferase [Peribacillus acanthi]|uniref:16S rRNA (uracil(1498)-N(3))-methyltransferase n=1 Tax=Peribacillus acanthi TaxID=2171554 RepID=UPI000D3E10B5|nr:16S rRNA (uracil(1498)-N(3))-methyltransferase [Peribacillus acanthi]
MQRYFIEEFDPNSGQVNISGEDVKHISKVMRMSTGDVILCTTTAGKTCRVEIQEITNEQVLCNVIEWIDETNELPIKVVIASGLPKGDKLEYIVQKGTELGACGFVPFNADRSIVKWDEKKSQKKLERLQKIAKEAAEQSHRSFLPMIHDSKRLKDLIAFSKEFTHKVVAFEEQAKQGEVSAFAKVLQSAQNGDSLLIVFGPEGGLSSIEIDELEKNGFIACGLGPRIMRTETAPLYALAAVSYQLELLR